MVRWILYLILFLILAITVSICAFYFDGDIRAWVVEVQGGPLWQLSNEAKFYGAVRRYGDWPYLMLYGCVALGIAWWCNSRKWQRIIIAAILASTLAGLVANTSRLTTGRTRPRTDYYKIEPGFYGLVHDGKILVGNPDYNSFPSGHTATAFGFALPFLVGVPAVGIGVFLGAAAVAWASIFIGAHHPSDVVVSFFIACLVSYFVWRFVQQRADIFLNRWTFGRGTK